MKTVCPPGYHHNGFVATRISWITGTYNQLHIHIYIYIYVYNYDAVVLIKNNNEKQFLVH